MLDRAIRPVVKVDDNGKVIKVYKRNSHIIEDGLKYNGVYKCATGYRKTYKGSRFFFLDEYKEPIPKERKDMILCLDVYGAIVKTYEYQKDVIFDGFSDTRVCECLSGYRSDTRYHGGHYWCYESQYIETKKKIEDKFIYQYQDGELVHIYTDIREVINEGYHNPSVYDCLNKKAEKYAGCEWIRGGEHEETYNTVA